MLIDPRRGYRQSSMQRTKCPLEQNAEVEKSVEANAAWNEPLGERASARVQLESCFTADVVANAGTIAIASAAELALRQIHLAPGFPAEPSA